MKHVDAVLDIGFGTGFPLLELSQRFGPKTKVFGVDIWTEAVKYTEKKIDLFGLDNVEIAEQDARSLPVGDESIDLICSNLGLNNFEDKDLVIKEAHRVLKKGGKVCLTTNPKGTFAELFDLFGEVVLDFDWAEEGEKLGKYVDHRATDEMITHDFEKSGFKCIRSISDQAKMRFADASAVFDHALIRIGFLSTWLELIPGDKWDLFYEAALVKINDYINVNGEFGMTIPMLYMEFEKV